MILLSALLSSANAALPDCPTPVTPAAPMQIAITTRIPGGGHRTMGGIGIAGLADEAWSLTLLAPAGIELFTLSGPPATVVTGLDTWRPWLARLPVERDLRLIYTALTGGACRAGAGRLRSLPSSSDAPTGGPAPESWTRQWCGPGGGATATRTGDRVVLEDHRRGYTLLIVGFDADR